MVEMLLKLPHSESVCPESPLTHPCLGIQYHVIYTVALPDKQCIFSIES